MEIKVSKSIYSKEVLLKTAYSLTDKVYLHLEQDNKDWIVSWCARDGQQLDYRAFENELISQALREELLKKTVELRQIILARAFASTVMDNANINLKDINSSENDVSDSLQSISEKEKEDILKGWFERK